MLKRRMNIFAVITGILFVFVAASSCIKEKPAEEVETEPLVEEVPEDKGDNIPLDFEGIRGVWQLFYPDGYGYEFRFYKNYRAVITLRLNTHALVFRGIYTLEDDQTIRVNLSEMKKVPQTRYINITSGYVKTKSSYFLFKGRLVKQKNGQRTLIVSPTRIVIDGNNSDGYFEPRIRLKAQ